MIISVSLRRSQIATSLSEAYMITIMLLHFLGLRQSSRTYERGQHLFHLGDPVRQMFLIEAGAAHLIRHGVDGKSLILQRCGAGAIVAEASLFADNYHCDAIAHSRTTVRLFTRSQVQQAFFENRSFAEAWAAHLASKVRKARFRAEILSIKTVAARVDAWIADRGRAPEKGNWKSAALEIGVSPESLYREMAKRRELRRL
jgi:CRP-like cAMP-binding protein